MAYAVLPIDNPNQQISTLVLEAEREDYLFVSRLIAQQDFDRVRLRTHNPVGVKFYESIGFRPFEEPFATHVFVY